MQIEKSPRVALALLLLFLAAAVPASGGTLRLGDAVEPTFQAIRLRLDPRQADYSGEVRIELRVATPTDRFRFHSQGLTLTQVELTTRDGHLIEQVYRALDEEVIEVRASSPLPPGSYSLRVTFKTAFNVQATAIYRVEKGGESYAFSQLWPADARDAFPAFDEPHFKIPFQLTLEVPPEHLAVTNTPVVSDRVAHGWRTVVFAKTPPLSTYLLALATGPLETIPIPGMGIPGRVVTVKGQSHLAGLAAARTPPILKALEAYFARPYPFAKLDLIAVPEFWLGAMENPGAVCFGEESLLLDPVTASLDQRRAQVSTIAHELAHMWFGDMVTMTWWNDLWLSESFATWMDAMVTPELHPELDYTLTTVSRVHEILELDAETATQAVRRPMASAEDMRTDIGLAYTKGQAILEMFEGWIGPEVFRRGVHGYLETHAWSHAAAPDLMKALDKASGKKVSEAMTLFLHQAGFPLIEIEPTADGQVRLRQRRFRNFGARSPDQLWRFPVALKYPASSGEIVEEILFLEKESATFDLTGVDAAPAWIFPKASGVGYYRWWVADRLLQGLAANASEILTPSERIELVGNLSGLLDAGRLGGDEFLRLLGQLAGDPEALVVIAVVDSLTAAKPALVPAALAPAFAAYVRTSFGPVLERIGVEKTGGEAETVSLLRSSLWRLLGDWGDDEGVLSRARAVAAAYAKDPASVDPALVGEALRLVAIDGDGALFKVYRARFEVAATPAERTHYLEALGGFRRPELRDAALSYVLSGPLRPDEVLIIPTALDYDDAARARRLRWMTESYDGVKARIPPRRQADIASVVAEGCSIELAEQARAFFGQAEHRVEGTEAELVKGAERVADCVRLRQREGAAVARFLGAPGG